MTERGDLTFQFLSSCKTAETNGDFFDLITDCMSMVSFFFTTYLLTYLPSKNY